MFAIKKYKISSYHVLYITFLLVLTDITFTFFTLIFLFFLYLQYLITYLCLSYLNSINRWCQKIKNNKNKNKNNNKNKNYKTKKIYFKNFKIGSKKKIVFLFFKTINSFYFGKIKKFPFNETQILQRLSLHVWHIPFWTPICIHFLFLLVLPISKSFIFLFLNQRCLIFRHIWVSKCVFLSLDGTDKFSSLDFVRSSGFFVAHSWNEKLLTDMAYVMYMDVYRWIAGAKMNFKKRWKDEKIVKVNKKLLSKVLNVLMYRKRLYPCIESY